MTNKKIHRRPTQSYWNTVQIQQDPELQLKDLGGWQTVSKKPTRYKGELAEREELAQKETKRKQNMVGQFYNKGGYGYMPDPDDFKTIK